MKKPNEVERLLGNAQLGAFSVDVTGLCQYIEFLEGRLHFAAGYLSGKKEFEDRHPQECLNWIMSDGETYEKKTNG